MAAPGRASVSEGFVDSDSRAWLAIDSAGNPQVAYRDRSSGELIHAKKAAGQWTLEHIPTHLTPLRTANSIGAVHFSLRPSNDVAHFVYTDLATDGIGFAHNGSLGPTPVPVHVASSDLVTFGHPSAAFDSSENFDVGYVKFFETGGPQNDISVLGTTMVGVQPVTFSQPVVVDDSPNLAVNRPTSIVKTDFRECLAYFDVASKTLKASVSEAGLGSIETVATNIKNVVTPSAAANGNAFRIAFADFDAVKLASRDRFGTWTLEVVDPVFGGPPSLAYDSGGTANIAYVTRGSLKYARRSE